MFPGKGAANRYEKIADRHDARNSMEDCEATRHQRAAYVKNARARGGRYGIWLSAYVAGSTPWSAK